MEGHYDARTSRIVDSKVEMSCCQLLLLAEVEQIMLKIRRAVFEAQINNNFLKALCWGLGAGKLTRAR